MVTFSTDKQTQPNFMRDSYVYVLVGLCDHALILHKTVKYQRQYFDFFFKFLEIEMLKSDQFFTEYWGLGTRV